MLLAASFCLVGLAQAELDQAFFDRLHTERVPSSDRVTWVQVGPGMSGYCEAFWCHPTDPNALFMSPDMFNSYGSWDGGVSWHTIKDCDGDGRDLRRVQAMAFSRQDPDFGYCTNIRGQLYRTSDRGRSWSLMEDFPQLGSYYELTVDPTDDHYWYLGAGDFWNVKAHQRRQDRRSAYRSKYAAYGHILKSTDRGQTWRKVTQGLPAGLDVGRIIVDPTNPQIIVMAADSGIYRSTNRGETWSLSAQGLAVDWPRDMTSFHDPGTGEFILYVTVQPVYEPDGQSIKSKGGLFKSLDHGATWIDITGNLPVNLQKISSPTARIKYYNCLANWFDLNPQEARKRYPTLPTSILNVFNRIVVDPHNKDEIYLSQNVKHDKGFLPGDVWKSTDGGQTWIATARTGTYWVSGTDADYWVSRSNPTRVNTTFAHLQPEFDRREENHGNRYLQINLHGDLFACFDQQVMRSADGGGTWRQADDIETTPGSGWWIGRGDSNLPGRFMLLETGKKDRYLLCSGEHGLWQTRDLSGLDRRDPIPVQQIEGQLNDKGAVSIATVAVHPRDPDTIYMLVFRQDHRGYFRRSSDGGKTWHDLSQIFNYAKDSSGSHLYQYSLTIDPQTPDTMYFCLTDNTLTEVGEGRKIPRSEFNEYGVFKTTDGGKAWKRENTGLPENASVNRLTMDPADPAVLYAALNESRSGGPGGLYKSTDCAAHWAKVTIPSPITAVNHIFVDRSNHHLFISCGTSRGRFDQGGVWRSKDDGKSWEKIFDLPWIWHTETSPVNPDIITVSAGGADNVPPVQIPEQSTPRGAALNPGAYLSLNGGAAWMKINRNLGQPDRIVEIKPDPTRENILWCALWGSGWAVGYIGPPPSDDAPSPFVRH
ncbi:MAG: hypothetical protein PSU94_06630 [Lacunisphaera sp.]|nr:hypothetical protein [Lacunisphaera sp.]